MLDLYAAMLGHSLHLPHGLVMFSRDVLSTISFRTILLAIVFLRRKATVGGVGKMVDKLMSFLMMWKFRRRSEERCLSAGCHVQMKMDC